MKIFNDTKGAVSLFLVIVLLPTLSFAGVFIDLARTKIAEETVTSAADLALNTLLSNYDSDLKDYFGLFGSTQSTEDIISVAKQYFADCMISAGVDTSQAYANAQSITDTFFGEDDIRDMLQLSVDGDVKIEPVKNSALDNPAMLKKNVIEFMKYRAPVNAVADLFSNITDSGVEEQMNNVSKETEMTNKKKEFYEAEEALIEQAEKAYNAIKKYKDYKTKTGHKIGDENYLNSLSDFLEKPDGSNDFQTIYKNAHTKMTKDLFTTHDSSGILKTLIKPKYYSKSYSSTTYSDNKKASADKVKAALTNYNNAILNYYTKRSALNSAWNSIGWKQNSDYDIQYWVNLTDKCSSSYTNYVNAAYNLIKQSEIVKNAITYASEGVLEEKVHYTKYSNSYATYEKDDSGYVSLKGIYDGLTNIGIETEVINGGTSSYKNITSQSYSLSNNNSISQRLRTDNLNSVYHVRNKANDYSNDLSSVAELAKKAKEETNKLKSLLEAYKNAFAAWDKAANDPELDDSVLACGDDKTDDKTEGKTEGDRKTILKLKQTGIEHFSEESVVELVNRLKGIQTAQETFSKDIKAIKYNGTSIINVYDYTSFYKACKLSAASIAVKESSLNNYANSSFSFTIGKQIQRIEIYDKVLSTFDDGEAYMIGLNNHFDITKNEPELYTWMVKTFDGPKPSMSLNESQHGFNVSDESSADDADSKIDGKAEDTSNVETGESLTGKNFSEWKGAALPSGGEFQDVDAGSLSNKLSEVSSFVSDIFSNFSGTFKNSLVNMRDDLFALDYIMNMFTYDTFEKELSYDMLNESQQKGLTPTKAQSLYSKVDWTKSEDADTLTLTPKNKDNNWAYGSEVEYILYGSATNSANKAKAYGNIYLIRYALDLSPVFQEYQNDMIVKAVATVLELWAHIPSKLTITMICLAITAAEAAMDLSYIRWGIPVLLIKTGDDLICSYKKLFSEGADNTVEDNGGIKLQYTDYIMIFMFIKLIGAEENNLYLRMGDVIQANMSLYGNSKFALSKAHTYYTLSATVKVAPMWSRILSVSEMGDMTASDSWRTINIKLTRGY